MVLIMRAMVEGWVRATVFATPRGEYRWNYVSRKDPHDEHDE